MVFWQECEGCGTWLACYCSNAGGDGGTPWTNGRGDRTTRRLNGIRTSAARSVCRLSGSNEEESRTRDEIAETTERKRVRSHVVEDDDRMSER